MLAASISFADKANRVSQDNNSQVWEQNGITFTNNKGSSTSNVADYANPVRCYKSSDIQVEYTGIVKLVFHCNSTSNLVSCNNISGGGVLTTEGTIVTITFETPVDIVTLTTLGVQARIDSIDVYTMAE